MNIASCLYCNVIFERKRSTKHFCSLECKNKYNYALKSGLPIPAKWLEMQRGENSQLLIDQKKIIDQLRREITLLKEKLKHKEELLQNNEKSSIVETDNFPSKPIKPFEKSSKSPRIEENQTVEFSNTTIPFLKKKERICKALVEQGITVVTVEDLKDLGYPCGFFDGWTEKGEQLEHFTIQWMPTTEEYEIKIISE